MANPSSAPHNRVALDCDECNSTSQSNVAPNASRARFALAAVVLDEPERFCLKRKSINGFVNQAECFIPPCLEFFVFCGPANFETNAAGKKKGRTMNRLIQNKKATPLFTLAIVLACLAFPPRARADCRDGCASDANTFLGDNALSNNTGGFNTAVGSGALGLNTTGADNTANGAEALFFNTTGNNNTANGAVALFNNTSGDGNTAAGVEALNNNTSGSGNIALGNAAGENLTTGDNNIDIGNGGVAGESNTIRIGTQGTQTSTYIAGISGVNIARGLVVEVDATGHLGTRGSSQCFKDQIRPMDKASEAILALKPVTFRYKKEIDPEGTPQFGLVAEQVEQVNPDLVVRDKKGKPYSVRYDEVNAMLLNEFLKEHKTVQKQGAIIARQQKQIEALTAGLQKVSAQLATASPSLADLK
jgi:hypothetical protein